jgi:hypothetical protein
VVALILLFLNPTRPLGPIFVLLAVGLVLMFLPALLPGLGSEP